MPITKLIVGGFKSIRERTEIPIAPLTLLFGPNSAGKSAVLAALDALSKKLTEKTKDEVWFVQVLLRSLSVQSNAHQHPPQADQDEPSRSHVTLGLEIDSFPSGETSFDGSINDARRIALDLYRALNGSTLRLEFIEAGVRFVSTVSVDGQKLVEFVDATTYLEANPSGADSPDGDAVGYTIGNQLIRNDHWDALVLQTDHPFWANSELASWFAELRRLTSGSLNSFTQEAVAVEVDGGGVVIRTVSDLFHARGWGEQQLFERSLRDVVLHRAGGESAETTSVRTKLLEATLVVDLICASVSFLVYQMRFIAHKELEFARVVGDRKVLADEDLTTEFDLPQSGDLGGSRLHDYAAWLGVLRAGEHIASAKVMTAVRERDDFINDTLRHDFFPARGYQVKPEVWQITTTLLLDRDAAQSGDGSERLKVSLFLEDANGRVLDFSEVGSGVSYVLPVLVSLWGADRSWIEQPELHLHPAAQCELGDVAIRAFNRGRFSIIETHSEHLLLRVLRRIRQTSNGTATDPELKCHPEAVSILYFEPLLDGSTKVRPIRVSRGGDFMDRWPHGFFSERDRELLDE